jgi:aminoglycoside phosphotransferase (APT) family kinase protein
MTGVVPWSVDDARETLSETKSSPLLDEAGDRLFGIKPPDGPTVFVHGDLWQGNVLFEGDLFVGLIDWELAGAGDPGVDLGCLRWDTEMFFGAGAADVVLAGWEESTGRTADAVAYWDLVAALNYPADIGRLAPVLARHGRGDLDAATLIDRRDGFVEDALARLDRR